MVRPLDFGFNPSTAVDNDFQKPAQGQSLASLALDEFENFVGQLRQEGVRVDVFDPPAPDLPDAVFPNNWLSTHPDGRVALYPMMAENRRLERNPLILDFLKGACEVSEVLDFSGFETHRQFLEGTGSLVFDIRFRRVYAAISSRTHKTLVVLVSRLLGYEPVIFETRHPGTGRPLYHTNVMLSVAPECVVWIPDTVPDPGSRSELEAFLGAEGRKVVALPLSALDCFGANVLILKGNEGPTLWASQGAQPVLEAHLPPDLPRRFVPLSTLEQVGGGSLRCMVCENFLTFR